MAEIEPVVEPVVEADPIVEPVVEPVVEPGADPNPKTAADPNALDDQTIIHPADWPEDWRAKMGGEEKYNKMLERYGSPVDFFKSHINLQSQLSKKGEKVE
ncbi:MAG: hypothetical protein KAI73_03875, partial [Rhodospirillaceae bacterium]|nr:hypothetical protein [Rhodospirillaceae bacterium]